MVPKQVTFRSLIYLRGILLSCALALLLFAPACLAALRFDVFVGYDGILPDKGWFPITCELQNDGPPFNAVIEVSAEQMGQGQTRRVKLDLPSGTLKRVVIPVFSGAQSWNVRLLDDRDHVRAEQTTLRAKVLPPDLPLVVGVCRTVHGLPVFPEMPARFQGATASTYGAARLTPELFPDNPLAMESIDLLYLNSEKALALSLPQATALKAWLEHGGHLVIGVEQSSDISGNAWLKELMPCEVTTAQNLADHTQLQTWLRAPWAASRFQQPNRQPNFNGMRGGRLGGPGSGLPVEIHGTVLSPDGKPVEGATIYLGDLGIIRGAMGPSQATTDKDGKFTLTGNANNPALLAAFSPDFGPVIQSTPTANGSAQVELRMTPPHSVQFRVVDPSGNPVAGANAIVSSWENFNYPPVWNSFLTDTEGRFAITNAPSDGFVVMAAGTRGSDMIQVQANRGTNEIVFHLDPNGRGRGAFVRGRRAGPPPLTPRATPSQIPPDASTIISDDPDFEAAPLPILTGPILDGSILIGDESAPLAVTADRGRGRITVLTFSPEREPFISWKDRGLFWAKLSGIPQSRLTTVDNNPNMAQLGTDGIFGAMIDSKQVRKLPLSWLLLLLAAYLVVIGPLDQYWLKKLNRQMLTWITFPLYVVAFSGLIYLIGFHLRAGELEWNELNVVDVMPGEDRAVLRGETYVSIYSPVNAHFGMASSQPYATLRGESAGIYGTRQESSQVAVVQIGNTFQAQAFVPVWTSQLFVSDWLQASPTDPMTMSATKQDSGWSVTVTNQTARPLTHTHLAVGGRLYDLGDLAPQQTKTFNLNTGDGTLLNSFTSQYANSFRNAVTSRRNSFGNNNAAIQNIEEASMAVAFLAEDPGDPQQVFNNFNISPNLDLSRFAGANHAILLAWDAGHSFADSINPTPIKRTHRNTLLRLVVPVKTP